ncbi:hypothetical protein HO133_007819 [Letharia lupina]|uniref:Uncharacterized protein n=1 Tax=Letharia lupina TaxID=560253 RepID=A0A8H6CRV4_9LECA|nr:uncharacterized protein HO133_007819 [Letharia lupina]KAF6228091.1 hypothetical protein HO133_007819 [Letharia lupina]
MENHVHSFLTKFRPAFGLLRNFRGKLPAKTPGDIESGRPDLIQSQSQDDTADATKNASQLQDTGSLRAKQEDSLDSSASNTNSGDDHENHPQPQFTEGPSRFVLAKDGSNDCVALLVNERFLAKLRDLFQENRDISALDGPLYHAKMDTTSIENSIQNAQESLKIAESEEQAEKYKKSIEQQASELLNIRHWKDKLEKEQSLIKGNLELSRSHTQWVLETAMKEADLLGPEKPLPAILLRDRETEYTEEEVEVPNYAMPAQSPAVSVASDHEEVELSEEENQRHAAYDDFIDRSQLLDTVQADFDDQQNNYRENLAMFQQKAEAGVSKMSRSDFDRRSVQYGQQLTRALIDAEEEFEEAREHAQALGAIGSDHGQEFYYGAEYEESWPENKIADYNSSHDWGFIHDWMDNIPNATSQSDTESVEIDEWDAEEVDVNDSISVIDREDYRQDIERYRRICARLEDPCPAVRWLGQPDAQPLERRYSFWM